MPHGALDLGVANSGNAMVAFLLGNGDGSFLAPETFSSGGGPWSIVSGNFKEDSMPDVAVANYLGNNVTVFRNTTPTECIDDDGDGYGSPANTNCPHPEWDCNDNNPSVNPGMTEIQGNGIDDDCNVSTPGWGIPQAMVSALLGGQAAAAGTSNVFNSLAALLVPCAVILLLRGLRRRR